MGELGEVISTAVISNASVATWGEGCPREAMGLSCLIPHYECVCGLVSSYTIEQASDVNGPTGLVLTLTVVPGQARAVMDSIDKTGLRADFVASNREVQASFHLRRPENHRLRSFLLGED